MRRARSLSLIGAGALFVSVLASTASVAAASSPRTAPRVDLRGSQLPAVARAHPRGSVSPFAKIQFQLLLSLQHPAGAQSFVRAVSSPGNRLFHHYLTDAQWNAHFAPSLAEVSQARSWLKSEGFSIGTVPRDRLYVTATGTAAQVERAFKVGLGMYRVTGHTVRLATGTLSIPSQMSNTIAGVVGVNQSLATPDLTRIPKAPAGVKATANQEPAPPAGFLNPQPCSKYWGQQTDTTDASSLYTPYTGNAYDICGYLPAQLRKGYDDNITAHDGSGVGIAIVDAYDSPTLFSDAQQYTENNDPTHVLSAGQFFNDEPSTVDDEGECGGSGWYAEQALDVESSHSMAPGAAILFVGAQDCQDTSLLAALQTATASGASVVSDSWGDTLGDLFTDAATHTAFDDTFEMADATGVSVLFSSGDDGDNFGISGLAVPNFPPTSPFVTAVGGTTLEIGQAANRLGEYGWSTAKQTMCAEVSTTNCGGATAPTGSLAWQAGGGGGTSYYYTQPWYQANVVPPALAYRNIAIFGPTPLRVEPDISMDADAQSGMLIGLTQQFPSGTAYGQFKEGGTSLASPLFAGLVADADQAAGMSLGFLNPSLYKASGEYAQAFNDIVPPANADAQSVIRVDYANTVDTTDGYNVSLRVIDYEGPESYCDATGNCATRNVTLSTGPGFDSLTGIGTPGVNFVADMSKF